MISKSHRGRPVAGGELRERRLTLLLTESEYAVLVKFSGGALLPVNVYVRNLILRGVGYVQPGGKK